MYKILFLLVVTSFSASCSKDKKEVSEKAVPLETQAAVNEYPDIALELTDGTGLRAKELKGNNVFILFQPDCDHCQEEAVQIEQRLGEFKDYTLYFISSAPVEQINAFARDFKLNEKPNVRFAWTATQGVLDFYGPIPTPSLYVYSDGRLKRTFNGQTEVDEILNVL